MIDLKLEHNKLMTGLEIEKYLWWFIGISVVVLEFVVILAVIAFRK